MAISRVFQALFRSRELIRSIRKFYLIIEVICAKCSFLFRSFRLAKWLFNRDALELLLAARFNSDWCNAFLLAFCLSKWIFNSAGLEWLGLDAKNSSALWSEFFLQRLFLIKGRWFITFLSRGNPVPCYPNMHFHKGNWTFLNCSGWYRFCDPMKYLGLFFLHLKSCI